MILFHVTWVQTQSENRVRKIGEGDAVYAFDIDTEI